MDIVDLAKQVSHKLVNQSRTGLQDYQDFIDSSTRVEPNNLDRYIRFSDQQYQRILVYRDSNLEVFVLCWKKTQMTPFHLHPDRGCVYKILRGSLRETLKSHLGDTCAINLPTNKCGYIDNTLGSHQMECLTENSVSIHFYAPPGFYKDSLFIEIEPDNKEQDSNC
jgi:hypothetical protein